MFRCPGRLTEVRRYLAPLLREDESSYRGCVEAEQAEQIHRVVADHPFLVGRHDEHFDLAVLGMDAGGVALVGGGVEAQSGPGQPFGDAGADRRGVLADAAGEY
jgi:hypothetical protein